jgi:hypothetical protein
MKFLIWMSISIGCHLGYVLSIDIALRELEVRENLTMGEWTKDKPVRDGWYWAMGSLHQDTPEIVLVQWSAYLNRFVVEVTGRLDGFNLNDFTHWIGPIEAPRKVKNDSK